MPGIKRTVGVYERPKPRPGLRAALEDIATSNPKAANANPDDFVDLTLVKQLNDSGFIRGLYP